MEDGATPRRRQGPVPAGRGYHFGMTELGAEIGEFATDNHERVRVALISFLVGGVAGPIGWEWLRVAGGISVAVTALPPCPSSTSR